MAAGEVFIKEVSGSWVLHYRDSSNTLRGVSTSLSAGSGGSSTVPSSGNVDGRVVLGYFGTEGVAPIHLHRCVAWYKGGTWYYGSHQSSSATAPSGKPSQIRVSGTALQVLWDGSWRGLNFFTA
jgi:hypothetical protein